MNDQAIEQEIQTKGKTAPRVTQADIEANIAETHYFTAAEGVRGAAVADGVDDGSTAPLDLLTFCVLVLRNGFTVTGESACASPENFDAEIGRNVARENAVQKIWSLMGYELKQELHRRAVFEAAPKVGTGAGLASLETKAYADGSTFTGTAPIPNHSPDGAPALPPHQQRVIDEKRELDDRLAKLEAFFETPIFVGLDLAEQQRLHDQAVAMHEYANILADRVDAFAPVAASDAT